MCAVHPADAPELGWNGSWVAGTETEAILELDYSGVSVFAPSYLENQTVPLATNAIIQVWSKRAGAQQMADVPGGAAADPASLGVAWTLAADTVPAKRAAYEKIIEDQVDYLLTKVPHLEDGTMSMRGPDEPVQLW